MRLDKFLKVSRIIKRRTVAKEIADKGRIMINDKPAKSGSGGRVGDTLAINPLATRRLLSERMIWLKPPRKMTQQGMYTVLKEDYKETF